MAKTIDRVMEMVRRALERDPDVRSAALYDQAKKVDRRIGQLTLRQFHALYPLQVKRLAAGSKRARKQATATATPRRRGRPAGSGRGPGRPAGTGRRGRPPGSRNVQPAAVSSDGSRASVRGVLLELASAVARAENKADVIKVLSDMDAWVERVVRAAR